MVCFRISFNGGEQLDSEVMKMSVLTPLEYPMCNILEPNKAFDTVTLVDNHPGFNLL